MWINPDKSTTYQQLIHFSYTAVPLYDRLCGWYGLRHDGVFVMTGTDPLAQYRPPILSGISLGHCALV